MYNDENREFDPVGGDLPPQPQQGRTDLPEEEPDEIVSWYTPRQEEPEEVVNYFVQQRPMPRATTAAWEVMPPRAVIMPWAMFMP